MWYTTVSGGSNSGRKRTYTSPYLVHETSIIISSSKSCLYPQKEDLRKPAEVGLKHLCLHFLIVKWDEINFKNHFLNFPSLKLKTNNILGLITCPQSPYNTFISTTLKVYFWSFLNSVNKHTQRLF